MNGHSGVAKHGLGPGGGHRNVLRRFIGDGRGVLQRVTDVIQASRLFLVVNLQVREGGGAPGTPVDDAFVPVDEALVVQVDEGRADRLGRARVQGELMPVPVGGDTQATALLVDYAAGPFHVLPDQFKELLPAQLVAALPLGCQLLFHHPLGGDAGMVGARKPQGWHTAHAPPPDQGVFQGLLQGVPQVQLAGHVRRRHDDGERSFSPWVALSGKIAFGQPGVVDSPLHVGGVIGPGHIMRRINCHSSVLFLGNAGY